MTRTPRVRSGPEGPGGRQPGAGEITVEEIVPGYVLVSWTAGGQVGDAARRLYRLRSGRKPPLEVYVDEVEARIVQVDVSIDDVVTETWPLPESTTSSDGTVLRVDLDGWPDGSWWEEAGEEELVLADGSVVAVLDSSATSMAALVSGSLTAFTAEDGRVVAFRWRLDEEQLDLVRSVVAAP